MDGNAQSRFLHADAIPPLTYDGFYERFTEACLEAFDKRLAEPTVTLPDFLWPKVTAVENPYTGSWTPITRIRAFSSESQ